MRELDVGSFWYHPVQPCYTNAKANATNGKKYASAQK